MTSKTDRSTKVSPGLAATIAGLPDSSIVRVIVLLNISTKQPSRRLTAEERSHLLAETRTTTARLLDELRPTLNAVGARRVDDGGIAPLGGVVLDVPAGGVARIADAEQVRMILGDQPLAIAERARAESQPSEKE